MVYEIDYRAGEQVGLFLQNCYSRPNLLCKTLLTSAGQARFFSGDQQGIIQKEISRAFEFELWINDLADSDADISTIRSKLSVGKNYLAVRIFSNRLFLVWQQT